MAGLLSEGRGEGVKRVGLPSICVTGYLGFEPHVLSKFGYRKGWGRMDVVQLLLATSKIRADAGRSQYAG